MKITIEEKQKVLEYLQKVQADYYKRANKVLGVDRIIDVDLSKVYLLGDTDRFNLGGYKLLVTLKEGTGFVFFGRLMRQGCKLTTITHGVKHYASDYPAPYELVSLRVPFVVAWEKDYFPPLAIDDEGKNILFRIYSDIRNQWQNPIATNMKWCKSLVKSSHPKK